MKEIYQYGRILFYGWLFISGSNVRAQNPWCETVKRYELSVRDSGSSNPVNQAPESSLRHAYETANPRIQRIRFAAVVPDQSSARAVLGKHKVSNSVIRRLDSVADKMEDMNATVFRSGSGIEMLTNFATAEKGSIVVLAGHSVSTGRGERKFVFPNGSTESFHRIHQYAQRIGIHLIIDSCHSHLNPGREISFGESYATLKKVSDLSGIETKADLIEVMMQEHRRRKRISDGMELSFVAATGAGVGGSVAVLTSNNEPAEQEETERDRK